ncbi:MAG: ABC transporter permease subunit [Eubacteriales bacterium]|nr:ABC transporter permease subunit [Eubacteriales bacterium]
MAMKKSKKQYKLLWMALPFMLLVLLFNYVPIFGWIYSVYDYVPGVPLFECDFMGLEYFKLILKDGNILKALKNTIIFAVIGICLTPLPMLFAILLNEVKNGPVRKFIQTFTTLPNFISWVIIFSLAFALFSTDGILTTLPVKLGIVDKAQSVLSSKESVYWFQTFLGQWKSLGWSSIIYLAAIAGIDQGLYEAARVDGAGHFRCALHVTLPSMIETYVVLFILNIGNFLNTGYEQYMLFKNSITAPNIEVLDLYVYRIGLQNMDYSYGVAISIIKSVVSITLVVIANLVAKKLRGSTVI